MAGVADQLREGARVISHSSVAHFFSPVLFDDVNFASTPYDPRVSYGQAKTANALFAVGLDARGAERGIHSYSVHPGGIMPNLQRHMPREVLLERGWIDAEGNPNPLFKTPAEGAATGLWAATAPELLERGGVYCADSSVNGVVPDDHSEQTSTAAKRWAIDVDAARRLWEISVGATGLDMFRG